ncbi:acyl-phosphate glycerol 3-phosphate acyltransferase [Photobacterium gaetbulicola]|uniref:Acyltransferase family protein n=1 Tax=Photobacterium gaetbulicola Gung47 TaxID=658445 RepID=A0A0C5WTY1_9GAMM|nr:AMP-binding protein [Photobacterium gaetbulicola]AJR06510.1 acyltransferase family protein [Photobacterium gaetbulicola Gung47]PSU03570.1 acyl-phosphate glycerol 3-phosphate acyltransferase [Photobacterium gaetbulicola]
MENPTKPPYSDPKQAAHSLLKLVTELAEEVNPGNVDSGTITLDSLLDQDLGLDSLARAELIQRTEQQFTITLPTQTLAEIETPRDLLNAIFNAEQHPAAIKASADKIELPSASIYPDHVETLQELLHWHVEQHGDRPHLYVYQDADNVESISYRTLYQQAIVIADRLQSLGIGPGDTVAIMLPTCNAYFYCFYGILLSRAIPVPIYPPARPSQIEDHLVRHSKILQNAETKLLITVEQAKGLSTLLKLHVPALEHIVTTEEIESLSVEPCSSEHQPIGHAQPDEIAFLQYTSGSTGVPKGVKLTHANLLANVRAMGKAVGATSDDVFVSWLPVYHDMGLIGAWFGSLYHAIPLVIMSPLNFLTQPKRWLWALHHHRGTLTAAPNFAYELCVNKITDADLEGLDLSSVRHCWNGAEPISPTTIDAFSSRFQQYGFAPEAMNPVYGLAESSVGLTFPLSTRKPRVEWVDRQTMMNSGKAVNIETDPIEPGQQDNINARLEHSIPLIGLGHPLPGHQIRIVDSQGRELPERQEGELEFKGPSSTSGYYHSPDKTTELYHGDWLRTGDRGLTMEGELFLTGRVKDIIIKAGRNIYPQELESAVSQLNGIRKGCVAVFASANPQTGTEQLVVLAETKLEDEQEKHKLRDEIQSLSFNLLGIPTDVVALCPPHTVPKTSSGKIRRSACKTLFEESKLDAPQRAVWWQATRLFLSSAKPALIRFRRLATDWGFACYMWLVMALLAPPVWILVAILPSTSACWSVARWGSRALIKLTGTKLTIYGLEHLPDDDRPYLVIANHASYLDGLVLLAATGKEHQFVAKSELKDNFFAHTFLGKLGTHFVERFDTQQSISDSQQLTSFADSPRPLTLFPEGTLYRMAGLHDFHLGAFQIAIDKQLPVQPITLKGTRSILRDRSLFPRKGNIEVIISPQIHPEGNDWQATLALRNSARKVILENSGEPDLARETTK